MRFPERLLAEIEVEVKDGAILSARREDYHGFHTDPFDWTAARAKFGRVSGAFATAAERAAIAEAIGTLDERPIADLTNLLGGMRPHAAEHERKRNREGGSQMTETAFPFIPRPRVRPSRAGPE